MAEGKEITNILIDYRAEAKYLIHGGIEEQKQFISFKSELEECETVYQAKAIQRKYITGGSEESDQQKSKLDLLTEKYITKNQNNSDAISGLNDEKSHFISQASNVFRERIEKINSKYTLNDVFNALQADLEKTIYSDMAGIKIENNPPEPIFDTTEANQSIFNFEKISLKVERSNNGTLGFVEPKSKSSLPDIDITTEKNNPPESSITTPTDKDINIQTIIKNPNTSIEEKTIALEVLSGKFLSEGGVLDKLVDAAIDKIERLGPPYDVETNYDRATEIGKEYKHVGQEIIERATLGLSDKVKLHEDLGTVETDKSLEK